MSDTELETKEENIYSNGSYVHISEDNMTAWLFLAKAEKPYSRGDIFDFLQANGVVMGYHTSNIAGMIKKHVYEREIKVALGKTNRSGKDGYFEYAFSPEKYKAPTVKEDGSVDYTSMSALQLVKAGDILAVYHPAVQGENGYTVTGEMLKAVQAKNLHQALGNGVYFEPDTGYYRAKTEGKVEVRENHIDVRNVHVIKGDVDLVTGRIDFNGDIIIWGNVEAGVIINSARNIAVHGTVEAAELTAGGDIVLTGGIQGGQKAKLSAKGNIFTDFIEHTTVEADGDVMTNSIMNSSVKSKGKVILTGKRGSIIGGYTHGLKGIEATAIGNDVEVKTIVHAGCLAEDQKRYFILKKAEADMEQNLSYANEELVTMERNFSLTNKTPNKILEKRIEELKAEKETYVVQLASIRKSKKLISDLMKTGENAKIVADGKIYRGTIVCIETLQYVIEHNTCYMRYFAMGGKMESNVIIKS